MRANTGFVKLRSVAAAAALLLGGAAQAGTVNWQSGTGYWQDTWHWSNFALPGATDDVVVTWPSATGNIIMLGGGYPTQYTSAEIGSLTLGVGNSLQIYAASLRVNGGIVNDGAILLDSSSTASGTLKIGSDSTLAGTGTLTLNNASVIDLNAHTLTIGGAQTVRGSGQIGNGNLINKGLIAVDGGLAFYPGAGSVDNSSGRITVGAHSAIVANQTSFTGGRIITASNGSIYGSLSAYSSPSFAKVTFEGDATFVSYMTLVDATNKGTIRMAGANTLTTVKGALVNDGSIVVDKTLAFQGDARLTGSGTVQLRRTNFPYPSAEIGYLDVAADSTLTIDGSQTVRGAGRILGSTDTHIVNHASVIAEGGYLYLYAADATFDNSAGRLTVAHDAVLGTTGTLILGDASMFTFDVGSSAADHGTVYLQTGTPQALDGTLQLNLGYSAQIGDSFSLFHTDGSMTGTFDQVIAAGYTVSTTYGATDLTVTITGIAAVPEPSSWLLAAAGLVLVGWRARRRA